MMFRPMLALFQPFRKAAISSITLRVMRQAAMIDSASRFAIYAV